MTSPYRNATEGCDMRTALTAKQGVEVILVRPGVGPQTFVLHEGATLADLLRDAGTGISSPNALIDGRPVEDVLNLKSGMIITVLPEPSQAPSNESWRETVGTVHDTPFFREMIAAGRAIREAEREAVRLEDEQNGP
jgi:hypothetical protein